MACAEFMAHGRLCDSNRFTDLANQGQCNVLFIFVLHLGDVIYCRFCLSGRFRLDVIYIFWYICSL